MIQRQRRTRGMAEKQEIYLFTVPKRRIRPTNDHLNITTLSLFKVTRTLTFMLKSPVFRIALFGSPFGGRLSLSGIRSCKAQPRIPYGLPKNAEINKYKPINNTTTFPYGLLAASSRNLQQPDMRGMQVLLVSVQVSGNHLSNITCPTHDFTSAE